MRSVVSIILSIIYFSLSISASINLHYCGGKIAHVSLIGETQNCCCGPGTTDYSCCNDENIQLELDIDQKQIINQNINFQALFVYSFLAVELVNESEIAEEENNNLEYFIPPKPNPIWLMNSNFTFYC